MLELLKRSFLKYHYLSFTNMLINYLCYNTKFNDDNLMKENIETLKEQYIQYFEKQKEQDDTPDIECLNDLKKSRMIEHDRNINIAKEYVDNIDFIFSGRYKLSMHEEYDLAYKFYKEYCTWKRIFDKKSTYNPETRKFVYEILHSVYPAINGMYHMHNHKDFSKEFFETMYNLQTKEERNIHLEFVQTLNDILEEAESQ